MQRLNPELMAIYINIVFAKKKKKKKKKKNAKKGFSAAPPTGTLFLKSQMIRSSKPPFEISRFGSGSGNVSHRRDEEEERRKHGQRSVSKKGVGVQRSMPLLV